MVTRDSQILVRVTEKEKEIFEEHVESEDSRYNSVSGLLRGAAQREINGGHMANELESALGNKVLDNTPSGRDDSARLRYN